MVASRLFSILEAITWRPQHNRNTFLTLSCLGSWTNSSEALRTTAPTLYRPTSNNEHGSGEPLIMNKCLFYKDLGVILCRADRASAWIITTLQEGVKSGLQRHLTAPLELNFHRDHQSITLAVQD